MGYKYCRNLYTQISVFPHYTFSTSIYFSFYFFFAAIQLQNAQCPLHTLNRILYRTTRTDYVLHNQFAIFLLLLFVLRCGIRRI